jgi:hypothetical protein
MRATPCCVVVMGHVGILVLLDAESFVGVGSYCLCWPKLSILARYR